MAKYFTDISGKMTEVSGISTSTGATDAGKFAQLDSNGRWDISLMPVGIGAEVTICNASEALTAGNFINLHNNAGSINARRADATTNAKPAQGFTLSNVASAASATIFGISTKNTALTGLTVGADYWLSTTPGGATATAPQATGNLVQELGTAESTTAMVLSNVKFSWTKA